MKFRKLLRLVVVVIIFISVRQQCFAVSVEKSVVNDTNGNVIYTTTHSYNDQKKVTEVKTVDLKSKVLVDYIYGYDANGNTVSEKDNLNGSHKEFKFDSVNQLVAEKYYDGLGKLTKEIDYQYDNKGNRTKKLVSCDNSVETTSYTYNKENQITKVNEKQDYTYDKFGNLVSDGKKTNTFDSKGELIQVNQQNKVVESYQYNAEGDRVKKESVGETEIYRYNDGQFSSIIDVTGKPKISFARDANGNLVSMTDNQNTYWYLFDGSWNVKGLADKDGTKVVSYEYDAFGNCTESQGSEIRLINPFRYMSYQYDEKTGYYYLGARYYDPLTGRFISADGYTGNALITSNLYKYANNNPLKYKDSTGHWNDIIDSKLPEWAQKEIRLLTAEWSNATTNEAKDRIHAKANCIRAYAEKQNPIALKGISSAFTVSDGSSGDDVRSLQQALNDIGSKIVVDGKFVSKTYDALCRYQASNSLVKDGVAGVETWAKLGEVYYGANYSKLNTITIKVSPDTIKILDDINLRIRVIDTPAEKERLEKLKEDVIIKDIRDHTSYVYGNDKINNILKQNGAIAEEYSKNHSLIDNLEFFITKVKGGGDWDLKLKPEWQNPYETFNGKKLEGNEKNYIPYMYYEGKIASGADVGNINFGYTGAAMGFQSNFLLFGAGAYNQLQNAASILKGNGKTAEFSWIFSPTVGDDPVDFDFTITGIAKYKVDHNK